MTERLINWLQEWKGRLIAYLGGGGVSVFSGATAAKAQQAAQDVSTVPDITTANIISIAGLVIIGLRLVFDVWTYFDKRKFMQRGEQQ
ncbi:hypothetical protein [Vibrio coralliilyticus]|uniref:hypothetical protein n=1 Tax=Vibrio coralliilyticus TaxID=190893 RepID=UPI001E344B91|nr:hypothetical protein [Vibrio coralliilyticus]MCC2521062.1 hypothetical protein [Vibrio coralliilyticus]